MLDNNNKDDTICNHLGLRIDNKNQTLYYTHLDEEFIHYGKSSEFTFHIEEIEDSIIFEKIDFLIRNGIKKLDTNIKKIYDFFNNRRMYQFREFKAEVLCPIHKIDGTDYVTIDDPRLGFTRADLAEIQKYLESISQTKNPIKGRDENNKKIRKKKRNKISKTN